MFAMDTTASIASLSKAAVEVHGRDCHFAYFPLLAGIPISLCGEKELPD